MTYLSVIAGCMAMIAAGAPANAQAIDVVRSQLASTGKLRVAFVIPNTLVVRKDPASGEFSGMSIELGREIAKRLGVGLEPVGFANVVELNKSDPGSWDIAVRSYQAERAAVFHFTVPFMEVDNTFLVPAASPLRHVSDFDRPGIRLVMPRESSPHLFFQRNPPKHASLELTTGPGPAIEMLKTGKADAFAQNKELLIASSRQLPGSRILEGSYDTSSVALAVLKERTIAAEYLNDVIREMMASGFLEGALRRSGLQGATVPKSK